eukprot:XP_014791002.1 PREDICTED: uncharacterized protein LOC106884245 isoform X2 [Octopus bimaculoides]
MILISEKASTWLSDLLEDMMGGNSNTLSDKDCSQLHILEPAWKFQRNRLTFEEVNNVFQAVHGMSCCHHCIVYNNFRIGKKVRDLIICGLSWIQHPFRISYQQEVFVDSLVTKEKQ